MFISHLMISMVWWMRSRVVLVHGHVLSRMSYVCVIHHMMYVLWPCIDISMIVSLIQYYIYTYVYIHSLVYSSQNLNRNNKSLVFSLYTVPMFWWMSTIHHDQQQITGCSLLTRKEWKQKLFFNLKWNARWWSLKEIRGVDRIQNELFILKLDWKDKESFE